MTINVYASATCRCKDGQYAGSIRDLVVKCDEFIEQTKSVPTKITLANNNKELFY